MNNELSTASLFVRYLPDVLEQSGYDPEPFLQRHQLTREQLNQEDTILGYDIYSAFLDDIFANTNIPALGLKTASHINMLKMGLYGYAMFSCRDLQQALAIHANYSCLQGDIVHDHLTIENNKASYCIDINPVWDNELMLRFEVEQDFAMWFKAAEMWWEEPVDWFQEVHFSFSRPNYAALYKNLFHCPVLFNQPENQFVFSTDYLTRPFSGFNAQIMQLTEEQCAKLLNQRSQTTGLTGQILSLLSRCGSRIPSAKAVAEQLNLSEITLRRRLQKEGTNYKTLLYEFRMGLASRYLVETQLTVKEIAYLTGYTNPANFTRAFTGFFSAPPHEHRAAHSRR